MSRPTRSICHAVLATAFCGVTAPLAGAVSRYTVTDLGALGGTFSGASSINNFGQILGTAHVVGTPDRRLFIWQNGVITDIGSPGDGAWAGEINDLGQVTGNYTRPGTALHHAFLYENGQVTDLGTLGGG